MLDRYSVSYKPILRPLSGHSKMPRIQRHPGVSSIFRVVRRRCDVEIARHLRSRDARIGNVSEVYRARCAANPNPHTGFVTAILSKSETIALPRGIAAFTAGRDRDAS